MTTIGKDEGAALPPPAHAERWLRAWNAIGGGISLDNENRVCPWRIEEALPLGQRQQAREAVTGLLRELDETDGLKAAVRVVVHTRAMQMLNRGLKGMGKGGLSDAGS